MAKKLTEKQRREQEAVRLRQERGRKRSEQPLRQSVEEQAAPTPDKKQTASAKDDQGTQEKKPGKKSRAKAAGLKSIFVLPEGELLMTSFGKGEHAVSEKYVRDEDISDLNDPAVFSASWGESVFSIAGSNHIKAEPANPLANGAKYRDDLIGCRKALEKRYFGREFQDNVHIQLIYHILDVEKILGDYINTILYCLNNVLSRTEAGEQLEEQSELYDLIGNLRDISFKKFSESDNEKIRRSYEFFMELIRRPQLIYFSSAFHIPQGKNSGEKQELGNRSKEEIYSILAFLATARHSLGHGDKQQADVYLLSKDKTGRLDILNELYRHRVEELNREFVHTSRNNLAILATARKLSSPEDLRGLVNRYYDFVVRKGQKNLGFSVRKLREVMLKRQDALDGDGKPLTDDKYANVRHKLYQAIDFLIYSYFEDHGDLCARVVSELRACLNKKEKEDVYSRWAKNTWKEIRGTVMEGVLPLMPEKALKALMAREDKTSLFRGIELERAISAEISILPRPGREGDALELERRAAENAALFCKLAYLFTLFLDGKEINMMLSDLVNKFDNIAGFLELLEDGAFPASERAEFENNYTMFNYSGDIARELRYIKSFARMQKPPESAKRLMFVEAAELLGTEEDPQELRAYFDKLLDKESVGFQKTKGFRNFIAKNVITNSMFQYLIRYLGPVEARCLANNKKLVRFTLGLNPDDQIKRYYESCVEYPKAIGPDQMRDELTELINGLSFREFENVVQNDAEATRAQRQDKQRKLALIKLYLTVIYHIVENLVRVNARYFMAFHIRERDQVLKYPGEKLDYLAFSEKALEEARMNGRARRYLRRNLDNARSLGNNMLMEYRNQVQHLNAVRLAHRYVQDVREVGSYFALYHYIMQRSLMEGYAKEPGGTAQRYFDSVKKYRTYCKDFTKALNIPLCYNLPRYKNLSIDCLFDYNRPGSGETRNGALAPDGPAAAEPAAEAEE